MQLAAKKHKKRKERCPLKSEGGPQFLCQFMGAPVGLGPTGRPSIAQKFSLPTSGFS
jgi:hypothetical protein